MVGVESERRSLMAGTYVMVVRHARNVYESGRSRGGWFTSVPFVGRGRLLRRGSLAMTNEHAWRIRLSFGDGVRGLAGRAACRKRDGRRAWSFVLDGVRA